jgi:hypothetical protein
MMATCEQERLRLDQTLERFELRATPLVGAADAG